MRKKNKSKIPNRETIIEKPNRKTRIEIAYKKTE